MAVWKKWCIGICCILGLLYLIGVWFFSFHFGLADLQIDSEKPVSVSFLSTYQVLADVRLERELASFGFVQEDGFSEQVPLRRLGVSFLPDRELSLPCAWGWVFTIWKRQTYTISFVPVIDDIHLQEGLRQLFCVSDGEHLSVMESKFVLDGDSWVFVPASGGGEVVLERLFELTKERVLSGMYQVRLASDGCYVQPSVTDETTFLLSDGFVCPDDFLLDGSLGLLQNVPCEVLSQCVVDEKLVFDRVCAYVRYLKDLWDTKGHVRSFLTQGGRVVSLIPSYTDTYLGWDMDVSGTASAICEALLSGQTQASVVWDSRGYSHGDFDLGDTYLEIDLTKQMLYYIEGWQRLYQIPVVTGLDVDGRRTPTGIFRILTFCEDYTMSGDYGTAFARYFLRLTLSGVGIHDALWRDDFSASNYLTDGSHGCINVPFAQMETLYQQLYQNHLDGVPVVIYE